MCSRVWRPPKPSSQRQCCVTLSESLAAFLHLDLKVGLLGSDVGVGFCLFRASLAFFRVPVATDAEESLLDLLGWDCVLRVKSCYDAINSFVTTTCSRIYSAKLHRDQAVKSDGDITNTIWTANMMAPRHARYVTPDPMLSRTTQARLNPARSYSILRPRSR